MNRYDTMSNTRSNILSNINQNQSNEFFKIKIGRLNFNDNKIAIIYKHESLHKIIPIFFGIKHYNENYDTFEEKPIIFKFQFVLFKPIDSINIYKNKMFIFYYSPFSFSRHNETLNKIDYTTDEFNSMPV